MTESELSGAKDNADSSNTEAAPVKQPRRWMAPDVLGPAPVDGPRDIWFFKLSAR